MIGINDNSAPHISYLAAFLVACRGQSAARHDLVRENGFNPHEN